MTGGLGPHKGGATCQGAHGVGNVSGTVFRQSVVDGDLAVVQGSHHITQRGNRRRQTFFNDGDYAAHLDLMADWCREKNPGQY